MNPFLGRLLTGLVLSPFIALAADPLNTLTAAEKASGWRLLFDGQSHSGWRSFKSDSFPSQGWTIRDGALGHLGKAGGGDIITTETFSDYEFIFEWRINADGNSGVKYFITEERSTAIGHEYQLLGPEAEAQSKNDLKHATGSLYDVLPPGTNAVHRPAGEWNQSRILVQGNAVEHWLNGARILSYELGSAPVQAGIAASKFKKVAGFGTKYPHHLLLQDHGGEIWFRNLKLKPLKAP